MGDVGRSFHLKFFPRSCNVFFRSWLLCFRQVGVPIWSTCSGDIASGNFSHSYWNGWFHQQRRWWFMMKHEEFISKNGWNSGLKKTTLMWVISTAVSQHQKWSSVGFKSLLWKIQPIYIVRWFAVWWFSTAMWVITRGYNSLRILFTANGWQKLFPSGSLVS